VLLLLIALLLFGAKRLPEIGRSLGHGMREFKDSVSGMGAHDAPVAQIDVHELQAVEEPVTATTPAGVVVTTTPAVPREREDAA